MYQHLDGRTVRCSNSITSSVGVVGVRAGSMRCSHQPTAAISNSSSSRACSHNSSIRLHHVRIPQCRRVMAGGPGRPVSSPFNLRHLTSRLAASSSSSSSSAQGHNPPADPQPPSSHDSSSSSQPSSSGASPPPSAAAAAGFTREALAAMALAPLAALSVPLATSPEWQESGARFQDKLRAHMQHTVFSDGFQQWWDGVDKGLTYMDWSYKWTGVDLTQVWDPELWVKFKEAVVAGQPDIFWNKLWDRVEYQSKVPTVGIVGDMRISYAKFLHLLHTHRIKRVIVYGDMKTAIAEVPPPWSSNISGAPGSYPFYDDGTGRPLSLLVPNPEAPDDPSRWFSPEMPEWNMEKYRFYVDLPGDFWESGVLLDYLKERQVQVEWDPDSRQYIMPWRNFTKLGEVRTEVQVLDPQESWAFMSWLLKDTRMEFVEKTAALCLAIRGLAILTNIISATSLVRFIKKKTKKKNTKQDFWQRMTRAPAKEFMSKGADGSAKDTGVRFKDIAGLDFLVSEMKEIVRLLNKDPAYTKVGAKLPKGIIFQGPPGTGKTYLARALAGEAGVTFLSAVGSEFVEMYAGVAAARVNSLYYTAREKAPCIIFIDEIDAIGRSRSTLGGDPGSQERESALLSMLVQLDGIRGRLDNVLTIGATNLASDLDQALLRPGRFEVVYELPAPDPQARLEILKYHSRNKPVEDQRLFVQVAEATAGWSAAALANLMNEAAILTVRRGVQKINLPMVLEIIEQQEFGPAMPPIPDTEAKRRLALVTAAKAVAMALTPGIDPINYVTMWSKRAGWGPYVEFIESDANLDADWHPEQIDMMDAATNYKVNAAAVGDEPLGEFLHVAGLIVPLYAGRALELSAFGAEGCSLATAPPIADAFELAYYCVRLSTLHPRFRRMPPLHTTIWLGHDKHWANAPDPLSEGLEEELGFHKLVLTLLKASWRRSLALVQQRRAAIAAVAEEMLAAADERLTGQRLVEIIESTPLDATDVVIDNQFLPLLREVLGRVPEVMARSAADLDAADNQQQQQQQQEAGQPPPPTAAGMGSAGFSGRGGGRPGVASFSRGTQAPGSALTTISSSNSSSSGGPPPPLKLDDATLATVSRAIMGRLDVVDLVGKNTALDVADRVVEALLDPSTVERLEAVRRFVEDPTGAFPPAPLGKDTPQPVYGSLSEGLEAWKRRRISVITWSAMDMLYTPRQIELYKGDADLPRYADTTEGRAAAAAGSSSSGSSKSS